MMPLANSYVPMDRQREVEPFHPLHVQVCPECRLVQLEHLESPQTLFEEYAYVSSYSRSWLRHCQQYAERMATQLQLDNASQVVEIGSNDGCLLSCFQKQGIAVHGVDPAANVAKVAVAAGIPTDATFFGKPYAEHLSARGLNADLLIANNVLAHVPDINDFVAGLKLLLKPDGLITVEFPHLLRLIESIQFDTIYHEHVSYLSLAVVQGIFAAHNLTVTDVEQLPTHGGSLRVFARHAEANPEIATAVEELIEIERGRGLERLDTYRDFNRQLRVAKLSLLQFLLDAKLKGARVAGYGAPAKATTLLNYCGVDVEFIDFTVDRNPRKQQHFIPGTQIPILHPDAINMHRPDYVVIFPWNLRDEITQQLAEIRRWGGQFVVPIPEVEVLP